MTEFANLVPSNGSLASFVNSYFFASPYAALLLVAIMLVIAVGSFIGRQLDLGGTIAMFFVGFGTTWVLGFGALSTLMLFFLSAAVMGKVAKRLQTFDVLKIHKKGGRRDAMQVFANGLMALVSALLYAFDPSISFLVMFGAAVGEAASDTFASEIGMLSKTRPISIITGKPMKKGLSGAITPLGLVSGLAGAVLIALCVWGCFLPFTTKSLLYVSVIALSSFFGCILDSVLGATVQAHYYDEVHNRITEHSVVEGRNLPLDRGIRWVDNDVVNLLSNVTAAIFGMALTLIIR